MAKILAARCDASALAIHAPQWDRSIPVTATTAATLQSSQPLADLGIRYTNLGCLLSNGATWETVFPSPHGPVIVTATGGPQGPNPERIERMRWVLDHGIRLYRARLAFSLTHRPYCIKLDADGEIQMQFRNKFTGLRSRWIKESQVKK